MALTACLAGSKLTKKVDWRPRIEPSQVQGVESTPGDTFRQVFFQALM